MRFNPFSARFVLSSPHFCCVALLCLALTLALALALQVRQLDDGHAEFDQDMLIDFVTDVSKALATVSGRTKVLLRGLHLAERATEMLEVCDVSSVRACCESIPKV